MSTDQLIKQLYTVYDLIKEGKVHEAQAFFSSLSIVDTREHLALPHNFRHLIWNLYEYLVVDNTNYTNLEEIMKEFEELLNNSL